MIQRRSFLAAAAAAAAPLALQAQTAGQLRWIVPYAAGGGSDVTARVVAEALKNGLQQTIIVDNRPGGGTIIGMQALLGYPADGTTVATADSGTLAYNPSLFDKLPYNIESSFAYIGGIGRMPLVLVTRPGLGIASVKDLLAEAAKNPGKLTYGSAGPGSPHHVAMEMFQQRTGAKMVHVPYKGAAPAVQDLLGGQIDLMMLDVPGGSAFMKSGKLPMLATAMPKRLSQLPNVPTMQEAGVPDFVAFAWQGMVAPAATPKPVQQKLDAELRRALNAADVQKRLEELGVEPMPMSGEQLAAYAATEQQRWSKVIKTAGIKLN